MNLGAGPVEKAALKEPFRCEIGIRQGAMFSVKNRDAASGPFLGQHAINERPKVVGVQDIGPQPVDQAA